MIRTIIKRNGTREPFIADKINGWGIWASENLKGVDWSEVVLSTVSSLPMEVTSSELQKALIDYCLSKKTWDYNRMAGRLYTALIMREIHGSDTYPTVKEVHKKLQEYGLMIELDYSDEEYEQIEKIIKHKNNLKLPQYALNQNRWKYALRDKVNGVEFETTQFIYMRMAMTICEETDKSKRMQEIEELYDEFTNQRINVPTPYYVNLGTKLKGFASCFPSGSVVTMLHGFKNIEDVKVGDYVVTHNNRIQRVYHTQVKPYKGKFVSINSVATMKDELRPTEEHRIYGIKCVGNGIQFTRRGYEPQREWIRADNLRHGDFVKLVYNDNVIERNKTIWDIISEHELIKEKYQLNEDNTISKKLKYHELGDEYKQPIVKNIDVFNIDMFRMFGYYLAEGSITYPKRGDGSSFIQFTMNSNDIDFINDIDEYLNSIGANFKIHVNPNDGSTKIISYSKVMVALFEIMCGIKFDGKILHKDLTTSDYELQKHLLAGVIRGDGTAVKSGYILVLHNETLIRQLRDIALRCKIRVNLKARKLRYKTIPYSLTFLADCDFSFIKLVNKNITKIKDKRMIGHNVLFLDDGAYTRVKEIHSYDDECEVYDLSVETDASFGISGVAVHNCNVMTTLDTAKSLATGDHIAYMMTVASAGIGYHLKTRSIGDPIKNGLIKHQGKVPYVRANIGAVGANLQSGRGGATTIYFNAFDPEIETLMKLKNPNTPLAKQARGADYSVGFNGFFIKKAIANQDIALFSYKDAPKLYELMYSDDTKAFEKEYQKFIDSDLPRTMVSARKIVSEMLAESFDTGRVYEHFTDTINTHTPFKDKIYQSNLCAEITLPTYGFTDVPQLYSEHDESLNFTKIVTEKGEFLLNNYIYVKLTDDTEKLSQRLYDGDETAEYGTVQSIETSHSPEIGLCNIGGIVVSNIKNDEQYAKTAYWVLRLIRYGILNSEYVFKNLEQTAKARMSAGVGIVGLAHLMAKNKLSYSSQEGKNFIHELAETHAWHLYNASLKIGQEFGNAEWMYKTKWVDGWTPIKTYNRNVDKLVTVGNKRDWDDLSRRIVENNGMAFSVCIAHMPAESCMDIDTKIKTENGIMSLKEIFALTGRDIEKELLEMNRSMDGGKWFKLDKPINVHTLAGLKPLTDVWLNGVTNYIEIELENGDVMRVTHHHKFLVRNKNGKPSWKLAIDLNENDDIVNVNKPFEQVA